MGCTSSSSSSDHIKVKVDMSWPGGRKRIVKKIPISTTVGQLKQKLNAPHSRLGHMHKIENWDNSRPLSDYFVKNGKSSFGNTILGKKHFEAVNAPYGVTKECKCGSREFQGKRIFAVDTPGFLDPSIEKETVQAEVGKAYQATAVPGPHVFLLAIDPGRFTREEEDAIKYLEELFGREAVDHTIIIFTNNDRFDPPKNTLEQYLEMLKDDSGLKKLLTQCGGRYLAVNNRGTEAEKIETIEKLLDMISNMIANNGGRIYRTNQFDAAAEIIADEKSKGIYNPVNEDGSIVLHPKIKEVIVEGFLRWTVGRKIAH